jgi:hypothetical protein
MTDYHTAGSLVWVHDQQQGWIKGDVQKVEGGKLRVRTEKGDVGLYQPEDCPLQNPTSRMGVEVRPSSTSRSTEDSMLSEH